MDIKEKKEYAYEIRTKGKSSIESVEKFYTTCDIDETDLRSLYILLAYGFEMILKSAIILSYDSECRKCLERELKYLSHDLIKISKKLGNAELNNIGIKSIKLKKAEYVKSNEKFYYYQIETTDDKTIKIEDFTDIRYPASGIRTVNHKEISEYIKEIRGILKKIDEKINSKD